jgi:predicted RNA binding protein YcfA (HicA-like mRNA interferase family)
VIFLPRLKPVSPKELIKVVEKLGYAFSRQKGSHATFINSSNEIIVIPIHSGKEIDGGLLIKIIKKELKITRKQFEELLY